MWRQTQYILYSLGEPSSPLQLSDMEPLSRHDGGHDGGCGGRHSTSSTLSENLLPLSSYQTWNRSPDTTADMTEDMAADTVHPLFSRRTRHDGGHDGGCGGRHSTSSILSENLLPLSSYQTWNRSPDTTADMMAGMAADTVHPLSLPTSD